MLRRRRNRREHVPTPVAADIEVGSRGKHGWVTNDVIQQALNVPQPFTAIHALRGASKKCVQQWWWDCETEWASKSMHQYVVELRRCADVRLEE